MLAKPRRAPRVESVRYGVKSTPNAPYIYYCHPHILRILASLL